MRSSSKGHARWLALGLVTVLGTACASGSGGAGPMGAGPDAPLPENRGFDGGTRVAGGFTMVQSSIQDSVITESPQEVWAVLPAVFETLGIGTPTNNSATLTIGDPGSRIARIEGSTRLSQYFDCGIGVLGPNADNYEITLQLIVQLGLREGDTVVRTTLDAYARPRTAAGDPIHCSSQRTLERRILELIDQELRPDPFGEGALAAGGASAPLTGRLPVTGDVLRIECRAPGGPQPLVGQGTLLGSGNGHVLLEIDSRGQSVAVPAQNVVDIQIRERRSRSSLFGIVGALLGAGAGAYYGSTFEDHPKYPDYHFGKEVFVAVGGVVGGLAGFALGRITGSFFTSDTWHAAPTEWAIRASGVATAPGGSIEPGVCPSFPTG